MARLTITLPDDLHQALKQASARRRRTIGDLVCESLTAYGIKPEEEVRALIEGRPTTVRAFRGGSGGAGAGETRAHRG